MQTGHPRTIVLLAAAGAALAFSASSFAQTTLFEAQINAQQQVPPNGSPATGSLTGIYDAGANTFSFSWSITDELLGMPSSPGAHIHLGPAGGNGPVLFGFNNPDGTWALSGSAVWSGLAASDVDALFNEGLYANFHTTAFPGGEVRGQIGVVPAPGAVGLGALGLGVGVMRRRRRER
ncbi:MAG: CHRD domain-containing protein [Phycisphaerales bacterium]